MIHLKKIIKSILIIIGLRKRNPKIASDVKDELNSILGGQKINFIDVGGAVNLQPHHNKLIGNAIFYVFEPDVRSYNSLVETVSRYSHPEDFFYINKALSGKDGKRTLYLSNVPTGTSILKLDTESLLYSEKNDYFFPMKEMEIDTFSLSSILKERKLPYFDAIKLDVQGAELEIIKGIDSAMLEDVNLIELEIGFHNIYLEQTDFSDVCAYMKENGFELFDLRINRTSIPNTVDNISYHKEYLNTHIQSPSVASRIYEVDAIFFRDINWIKKNKSESERIARIIALYCIYNFYAEALQMANHALAVNLITSDNYSSIIESIKSCHKKENSRLTGFHGELKNREYYTWGQYMWVPYPSN